MPRGCAAAGHRATPSSSSIPRGAVACRRRFDPATIAAAGPAPRRAAGSRLRRKVRSRSRFRCPAATGIRRRGRGDVAGGQRPRSVPVVAGTLGNGRAPAGHDPGPRTSRSPMPSPTTAGSPGRPVDRRPRRRGGARRAGAPLRAPGTVCGSSTPTSRTCRVTDCPTACAVSRSSSSRRSANGTCARRFRRETWERSKSWSAASISTPMRCGRGCGCAARRTSPSSSPASGRERQVGQRHSYAVRRADRPRTLDRTRRGPNRRRPRGRPDDAHSRRCPAGCRCRGRVVRHTGCGGPVGVRRPGWIGRCRTGLSHPCPEPRLHAGLHLPGRLSRPVGPDRLPEQTRDGFVNVAEMPGSWNLPYVLDGKGTEYRSGPENARYPQCGLRGLRERRRCAPSDLVQGVQLGCRQKGSDHLRHPLQTRRQAASR